MALAYLLSKASAKLLKVHLNIPLILVLSIIPDIDILFEPLIEGIHRGPTHSIILAILVFIPFFALYRQKAIPYFAALVSHSLISDFFIGGQIQLIWPLSTKKFGIYEFGFPCISICNPMNIVFEFTLFVIALLVMLKTRDLYSLFRNNKLNFILIVPISTVLLPTFLGYPVSVPILLVLPHLFYLVLFSVSVLILVVNYLKNK